MIDDAIIKLQELLIKQKFKDEKVGIAYIKKVDAYQDLIKLLKKMKGMIK